MKFPLTPTIAALGLLFVSNFVACSAEEIETEIDCFGYCNKAAECNGDVDVEECRQDCEDTLNDCMEDEREQAQDKLDQCSDESCDDFTACTIDAGAQCFFGL